MVFSWVVGRSWWQDRGREGVHVDMKRKHQAQNEPYRAVTSLEHNTKKSPLEKNACCLYVFPDRYTQPSRDRSSDACYMYTWYLVPGTLVCIIRLSLFVCVVC